MTDETHLLVEFTSANGTGVLNAMADHKLVSHVDGALSDGGSTGRWAYLTCLMPGLLNRKVLGTVVATRGARVLFFPGYDIEVSMGIDSSDLVHHITLDPRRENNRRSSHISLARTTDGERGQRGLNHQVGSDTGDLDYWFTLSVPVSEAHLDLPAVLRSPVSLPSRGLVNRVQSLVGERMRNINVGLPPEEQDVSMEVLQLDIWTGADNPSEVETRPMGFRFDEADPVDTSIRPAGRTDFDFGGRPPWVRIVTTWRAQRLEGARITRSRFTDGFAELLT